MKRDDNLAISHEMYNSINCTMKGKIGYNTCNHK